jgi:hypothetical protein
MSLKIMLHKTYIMCANKLKFKASNFVRQFLIKIQFVHTTRTNFRNFIQLIDKLYNFFVKKNV